MDCLWAKATGMEFKRYIGTKRKDIGPPEWEATLPRWSEVTGVSKHDERNKKTGDELFDEFFAGFEK